MKKSLHYRNNRFRLYFRLRQSFSAPARCAVVAACALTSHAAISSIDTPPAAHSAHEQITRDVTHRALNALHDYGDQQGWVGEKIALTLFIPPTVNAYPICPQPLKISVPDNAAFQLNHQRYEVSCAQNWLVTVNVHPEITLPVVMAQRDIPRGETLTAEDITLRRYNISNDNGKFMTGIAQALGKQTRAQLHALRPVTPQQLTMPMLIKRGDEVTIDIQVDGIDARTTGSAMKNGHEGDIIGVSNTSSHQVVKGKVQADGSVMVAAPAGER